MVGGSMHHGMQGAIRDAARAVSRVIETLIFFSLIGLYYGFMSTDFSDLLWKVLASLMVRMFSFTLLSDNNRHDVIPYVYHGSLGFTAGLIIGGILAIVLAIIPSTMYVLIMGICVFAAVMKST